MMIILLILVVVVLLLIWWFVSSRESTAVVMSVCGHADDVKKVKELCDLNNYDLIVYDKCNDCKEIESCSILPNVGREQGTWLNHVMQNYDNLHSKILFLPAPIHKYDRLERGLSMLKSPNSMGGAIGPHENFTLDNWNNSPLIPAEVRPFKAWYEKNIGQWNATHEGVYINGVMATTRERIRSKPLEFYMNLHRQVSIDNNTEVGHYLERSMGSVF